MNSKDTKEQDQTKIFQDATDDKLYGKYYIFLTTSVEKFIWARTERKQLWILENRTDDEIMHHWH